VSERGETLLAEEALVEGVVEVLDRAVAPRLPGRHEARGHPLVEACPHDQPETLRPSTMEVLETFGVPVIDWRTDR
jgi:hypothetical protein